MTDLPTAEPMEDELGPGGVADPDDRPAPSGGGRHHRKARHAKSSGRNIAEWAVVLVGAVVIAGLIRAFLFQAFYIPSPSMNPTLVQNDRVVVNKLSYTFHDVHRSDVIVFSRPPGVPKQDKDLIKRVIGLPGETVSLRGGRVYIDGKPLNEPYVAKGSTSTPLDYPTCTTDLSKPLVVPEGHGLRDGRQPQPVPRQPLLRSDPGGPHRRPRLRPHLAPEPHRVALVRFGLV